jgi:N-acetylglucosamine kinase-like BadF-type ATPase
MEEGWGPQTILRAQLLGTTGAANANELMHRFYDPDWPRDRIASLAPLVDASAVAGDPVALEILQYAALQLATLASAAGAQLWRRDSPVEVAYSGGVFRSESITRRFRELVELEPNRSCAPAKRTPAEGALLESYRSAGLSPELRPAP